MKKLLILFFLLNGFINNAQTRISGKVLDSNNHPLIGAAVYLNNTSIGTTTNDLGEFELFIKAGVHDLIISYLGYETIQYKIDTKKSIRKFTFKTKETGNVLDEIVLNSKKYSDEDRAYFLSRFRKSFIGKTIFADNCKIENPDVIQFDYNPLSNVLEAYVTKPIKIINKSLGYIFYYDLVYYKLSSTKITYLGYSRYEQIKGGKSKQRKWKQNRLRAYNGSKMHFIRAARNGTLYREGYIINLSKRILNPERPSDSLINDAKKHLAKLKGVNISMTPYMIPNSKNIKIKKSDKKLTYSKKDSLLLIIRNSRLKKFIDVKIKDSLTEKDFLIKDNNKVILKFQNYLDINYMNEKEEYNFRKGPNRLNYQSSKIILFTESVLLDPSGIFIEPLDVFMEGYWGYEKIADALPLDYTPKE